MALWTRCRDPCLPADLLVSPDTASSLQEPPQADREEKTGFGVSCTSRHRRGPRGRAAVTAPCSEETAGLNYFCLKGRQMDLGLDRSTPCALPLDALVPSVGPQPPKWSLSSEGQAQRTWAAPAAGARLTEHGAEH